LQELVIPVLTVRFKAVAAAGASGAALEVRGIPAQITNRIFTVTVDLGLALFAGARAVRPVLLSAGRTVGKAGMAVGGALDRGTDCIQLEPGKQVTIGFVLSDDSVATLRVVVQDPTTDAELFRSPEIPVRLGV
jgi:hypothetical protein